MSDIGSSWSGSLDPSRPMQSPDFIWTKKKSLSKSYCEKLIKKYEYHKEQQHEGLVGVGVVNKSIKLVQINLCRVTSNAPIIETYLKKIVPKTPHHKEPMVAYNIPFLNCD